MQLNVEVTDKEYDKLLEKAKDEVRRELTDEALEKYLKENFHASSLADYLRLFDLYGKAEMIQDKKVKDLTRNDRAILAFTWLGFENLFGR